MIGLEQQQQQQQDEEDKWAADKRKASEETTALGPRRGSGPRGRMTFAEKFSRREKLLADLRAKRKPYCGCLNNCLVHLNNYPERSDMTIMSVVKCRYTYYDI